MQQSRIFVGMVLILIFGEVLGLYGYDMHFWTQAYHSLIRTQPDCVSHLEHQSIRLNKTCPPIPGATPFSGRLAIHAIQSAHAGTSTRHRRRQKCFDGLSTAQAVIEETKARWCEHIQWHLNSFQRKHGRLKALSWLKFRSFTASVQNLSIISDIWSATIYKTP